MNVHIKHRITMSREEQTHEEDKMVVCGTGHRAGILAVFLRFRGGVSARRQRTAAAQQPAQSTGADNNLPAERAVPGR